MIIFNVFAWTIRTTAASIAEKVIDRHWNSPFRMTFIVPMQCSYNVETIKRQQIMISLHSYRIGFFIERWRPFIWVETHCKIGVFIFRRFSNNRDWWTCTQVIQLGYMITVEHFYWDVEFLLMLLTLVCNTLDLDRWPFRVWWRLWLKYYIYKLLPMSKM